MSDYKWTDHRMDSVAKRMGKYPWQFLFDQESDVIHHHTATDSHREYECKSEAFECDSDMTFSAAIQDVLSGEKKPCPHCLSEFPTSMDEVLHAHFPDPSGITKQELEAEF